MTTRFAARPQEKYRPAFSVKKIDKTVPRTILSFNKAGEKVANTVDEPFGYLVTFPKKHSIRVATDAKLHELGFDGSQVPLVDGSGEVVGFTDNNIVFSTDDENTLSSVAA